MIDEKLIQKLSDDHDKIIQIDTKLTGICADIQELKLTLKEALEEGNNKPTRTEIFKKFSWVVGTFMIITASVIGFNFAGDTRQNVIMNYIDDRVQVLEEYKSAHDVIQEIYTKRIDDVIDDFQKHKAYYNHPPGK